MSTLHANLGGVELWQWLMLIVLTAVGAIGAYVLSVVVVHVGSRAARLTRAAWDDQLVRAGLGPLRLVIFIAIFLLGSKALMLPEAAQLRVATFGTALGIIAAAWFAVRFIRLSAWFLEQHVTQGHAESAHFSRGVKTQTAVLRRVAEAVVYVLAAALLLLQIDGVRSIGVSLLASAGVAGLVIGLAAQKSISTLLAGIQLSLTQPVRLGDTVIVENEWGWVEEITLTYVVVRVWDLRRLVLPMSWFLERPFQNWSKVSPEIMGTVELPVDPRADLNALREELRRVLAARGAGLWDGKTAVVEVTGCSEMSVTARVLLSSADAGKNWDLRCLVREHLVQWLRTQPHGLPILRAETTSAAGAVAGTQRNAARGGSRVL